MSEEHHYQHDPDQTELEKWINAGLNKAEPYTNQILMGFIAATVIGVVAIFWFRSTGEAASAGWSEFVTNEAPDDYAEVAKENPDTAVAVWAKLQAGRLYLNEGINTALTNRETSDEQLNNAKDAFNSVLDNKMAPAPAREGALYGLASALEALSNSDTGPAIKAYEALLDEFPESTHAPWSKTRIESLKTGEAQNFYAWFRKQNLELPDRPRPNDVNTPGTSLLDNLQLTPEDGTSTPAKKDGPQAPDLPEGTEKKPAADTKPAEMKPEEKPATEETAKPEDKPKSEEKPAVDDKPKAEEKPAEPAEPKTEDKPAAEAKPKVEEKPAAKPAPKEPAAETTKAEEPATESEPPKE